MSLAMCNGMDLLEIFIFVLDVREIFMEFLWAVVPPRRSNCLPTLFRVRKIKSVILKTISVPYKFFVRDKRGVLFEYQRENLDLKTSKNVRVVSFESHRAVVELC